MKIVICLLLLVVQPLFSQAEEFQVFQVRGKITYGTDSIPVSRGNIIKVVAKDSFQFSTINDMARLWNMDREEYVFLCHPSRFTGKKSMLTQKEYTSTRGGDDVFSYLFIEKNRLMRPKKVKVFFVPKDEDSHYFFEYKKNADVVRKKLLLHEEKTLFISHDILEPGHDGTEDTLSYGTIGFYDAVSDTDKVMKGVHYVFKDFESVRDELALLEGLLEKKGKAAAEVDAELKAYLKDSYGSDIELTDFRRN